MDLRRGGGIPFHATEADDDEASHAECSTLELSTISPGRSPRMNASFSPDWLETKWGVSNEPEGVVGEACALLRSTANMWDSIT